MQNLSFQTTQNTPLKNLTEPAKKNDTSTDGFVSGDANTSFQLMLAKQLQAKTKQGNGEQAAVESNSKSKAINVKTKNTNANEVVLDKASDDLKTDIDADSAINLSVVSSESVVLDAKVAKEVDNKPEENKPEGANTVSVDTNALAVALIAQPITLEKLQVVTSVTSSNAASQMPSKLELATQNQQSLVAGLSNSLLSAKSANIPQKGVENIQPAGDQALSSKQESRVDAILKPTVGGESTEAKTVNGATNESISSGTEWQKVSEESARLKPNTTKDLVNKDAAIKDIAISANFQSLVQISTTIPAQQVGSVNTINVYPGKPGWDQAISQKVLWMVGASEQSATLTLNPPDLGPLQVVINVNNDRVDTTFMSDNAEVRQALQDGMSNLRDKMSESGIQLGQANVNSGRQSQQEFQQATQNRPTSQHGNAQALPVEKTASANAVIRTTNGLVDTFV
jgi:flagellar hook-length control protein FliK